MDYFDRKWAYYARTRDSLPSGYRRVEYLECSGAQYIDTGVNGGSDLVVSCELYSPDAGGIAWGCIQQEAVTANSTRSQLQIVGNSSNHNVQFFADTNMSSIVFSVPLPARLSVSADFVNGVFSVNGTANARAVSAYSMNVSVCLFARHVLLSSGVYDVGSFCNGVKAYWMRIRKEGVLTRNLVPCVRIADSKPGLYDLCGSVCPLTNSPFYVNAGSGADFTWSELS